MDQTFRVLAQVEGGITFTLEIDVSKSPIIAEELYYLLPFTSRLILDPSRKYALIRIPTRRELGVPLEIKDLKPGDVCYVPIVKSLALIFDKVAISYPNQVIGRILNLEEARRLKKSPLSLNITLSYSRK